jgi:hypothetical protein
MKLKLLKNGQDVVTRSVLAETFPSSFSSCQEYEYINEDDEEPDYEAVAALFAEIVSKGGNLTAYDSELAVALHKMLPLSRHEAARIEFWHTLAIDHCAEYVQCRWDHTKDFKNRYTNRWSRNAIGRLWWWAELTKQDEDDPYRLTAAINDQRFHLWIVDKLAAGHSILTKMLCEAFVENYDWAKENVGQVDNFTDEIWRHVNIRLATVVLDAMDEDDVVELVEGCVDTAKAKDWSS